MNEMCENCDALIPDGDEFWSEDGVRLCLYCYEELQQEAEEALARNVEEGRDGA